MAISLSDASASRALTSNESSENLLNIGVIGYGYWGPNIVRNFHGQQRSRVVAVCDKNANSLAARAAGVSRNTHHQRLPGIIDFP